MRFAGLGFRSPDGDGEQSDLKWKRDLWNPCSSEFIYGCPALLSRETRYPNLRVFPGRPPWA